jgi:dienelactone hydrolase
VTDQPGNNKKDAAASNETDPLACSVDPATAAMDQKVSIRVTGLAPREEVTLTLSTQDAIARSWQTGALYKADRNGVLDLAQSPVASRLYPGSEYMYLFSHLKLNRGEKGPHLYLSNVQEPMLCSLEFVGETSGVVRSELKRQFTTENVTMKQVRQHGLIGSYFAPITKKPVPGLLIIGGAIGGSLWTERAAALLANRGFACLALTYFNAGNLPDNLVEIPLEYFTTALAWLREQDEVNENALGIVGKSKGAEAALLIAERAMDIRCVVCYSAPAVVYQGVQASGPVLSARSSWTHRGQPLPFVPCYQEGQAINLETLKNLSAIHSANLDTNYIVRSAAIKVENSHSKFMFIAGEADEVWPSVRFGEMLMSRLAASQRIHGSLLLTYPNAGHGIDIPFLPPSPVGGGSVIANAKASEEAWQKMLEFLNKHLS